jgi:hypothetical protein
VRRDGESIKLFLPNGETKYFSQQDWTAIRLNRFSRSLICPSGKSVGLSAAGPWLVDPDVEMRGIVHPAQLK